MKFVLPFVIVLCLFKNNVCVQTDILPVNKNVKEVIVVFKTHFDIGYTRRVKDVV